MTHSSQGRRTGFPSFHDRFRCIYFNTPGPKNQEALRVSAVNMDAWVVKEKGGAFPPLMIFFETKFPINSFYLDGKLPIGKSQDGFEGILAREAFEADPCDIRVVELEATNVLAT